MIDKIENINLIKSEELRNNIYNLYDDVIDILIRSDNFSKGEDLVRKLLYNYVLGVGKPISICDSVVYAQLYGVDLALDIEMLVDYRVTYGYKPYQTLDKPIRLRFEIYEKDLVSLRRDKKLNELGV